MMQKISKGSPNHCIIIGISVDLWSKYCISATSEHMSQKCIQTYIQILSNKNEFPAPIDIVPYPCISHLHGLKHVLFTSLNSPIFFPPGFQKTGHLVMHPYHKSQGQGGIFLWTNLLDGVANAILAQQHAMMAFAFLRWIPHQPQKPQTKSDYIVQEIKRHEANVHTTCFKRLVELNCCWIEMAC